MVACVVYVCGCRCWETKSLRQVPGSSFSQSSQEAETQLIHTAHCPESILHGALGTKGKGIQIGQEGSGKAFWRRWHRTEFWRVMWAGRHGERGSKGHWVKKTLRTEREMQRQNETPRDGEILTATCRGREKAPETEAANSWLCRDCLLLAWPSSSSGTENSLADP